MQRDDVWNRGDVERHAGAVAWLGVDVDGPSGHADALDHRHEAQVQDQRAAVGGPRHVEAASVVCDLADQSIVAVGHVDSDLVGLGVLADVSAPPYNDPCLA